MVHAASPSFPVRRTLFGRPRPAPAAHHTPAAPPTARGAGTTDSVGRTRAPAARAPLQEGRGARDPGALRAGELARRNDWRTNARGAAGAPAAGAGTARAPEPRGTERRAPAPWVSQHDKSQVERAGPVACYRACREMSRQAGVHVPDSTTRRIQVATNEDARGRVTTTPESVRRGRAAIDRELDAGRPVTVGVSLFDSNYNRDKITDHFVLITGRGTDRQGRQYYTYNDPIARDARQGTGHRFYADPRSGNLHQDGLLGHAELAMVVPGTSMRRR